MTDTHTPPIALGDAPPTAEDWMGAAWRAREDVVFPALLGAGDDAKFHALGDVDAVERWLSSEMAVVDELPAFVERFGVVVLPPRDGFPMWTAVTSGLTNPIFGMPEDEDEPSGFGWEWVVHTPAKATWVARDLLELMAYTLVCQQPFGPGHVWPLGKDSGGFGAFVMSEHAPHRLGFELPSGPGQFLLAVGLLPSEVDALESPAAHAALMTALQTADKPHLTRTARDPWIGRRPSTPSRGGRGRQGQGRSARGRNTRGGRGRR